jgi:hypothetical protein
MRVSRVAHDSQLLAKSRRIVARRGIQIGVALCLVLMTSCPKTVKPGATFDAWILTKGSDGKMTPQGSAARVDSAAVESVHEISNGSQTLSLIVCKIQYGKATFDVIFPDKTTLRIQVKAGQPKDILPSGQAIGVRIEIVDSH